MNTTLISSIQIPDNRQRRNFDPAALAELTDSIARLGLLHPIVVRQDGDNLILVAGERRLKALDQCGILGHTVKFNSAELDPGYAPYVFLGELSRLEALEAEYEENAVRADLTWQEKAAALRLLHDLRVEQAAARGQPHSVADTALEVMGRSDGWFNDNVKKSLAVSKVLDNPLIAKARSVDDAFKILKKQEQADGFAALAKEAGTSIEDGHKLQLGDCQLLLQEIPAATFDTIITDPPYGIGADGFGDAAGKLVGLTHEYEDSRDRFISLLVTVLPQLTRVAKPQAHLYIFCDIDGFHEIRARLGMLGWRVFRTPLILYKMNSGRVPFPEHGPRRQYELILYAWRGDKPVNMIRSDVITISGDPNLGHGAQKPVAAYVDLLERSVRPGDWILDPFVGTGTVFPAANYLRCYAHGIEMDPTAYGIAVSRIREQT